MAAPSADVPSDLDVLIALRAEHRQSPDLSRNQLCAEIKADNQWPHLSNKHLKRLTAAYPLDSDVLPPVPLPPPRLPTDAFAAQKLYKATSTRTFRIYGRAAHDFGVSPNSDMQIMIDIMHNGLVKVGCPGPFDEESAAFLGKTWPLQGMLERYWTAAQKTGGEVTWEDCGRQLAAEYGVDPLPFYVEPSEAINGEAVVIVERIAKEGY